MLDKPKGQSRMDNPEKPATLDTQDEDKQNKKHNTIYVGHHHTQDTRRRQKKNKKKPPHIVLDTTICKQTQIT